MGDAFCERAREGNEVTSRISADCARKRLATLRSCLGFIGEALRRDPRSAAHRRGTWSPRPVPHHRRISSEELNPQDICRYLVFLMLVPHKQ